MLLHSFLCETKFLAFTNMQVDLVSDVCDYGGALEIVRLLPTENMFPPPANGRVLSDHTAAISSSEVDL